MAATPDHATTEETSGVPMAAVHAIEAMLESSPGQEPILEVQPVLEVHLEQPGQESTLEQLMAQAVTALKSLEERAMMENLSGAEAGRLIVNVLEEFDPHGPPTTWRPHHSQRQLLEIQQAWSRSCRKQGITPKVELWNLVVESAYSRAVSELEADQTKPGGQSISLGAKIHFWRTNIPEARGSQGSGNFLEAQRQLQLHGGVVNLEAGSVLFGDLVSWRHSDLVSWTVAHPGASPMQP